MVRFKSRHGLIMKICSPILTSKRSRAFRWDLFVAYFNRGYIVAMESHSAVEDRFGRQNCNRQDSYG